MNPKDYLFVQRLPVQTVIGVLPHERHLPQTLWVDLELYGDFRPAAASDCVEDAVNYAQVAEFTAAFAQKSTFQLLEAFGEKLCAALLVRFHLDAVKLKLEKPAALAATRAVGLVLYRERV